MPKVLAQRQNIIVREIVFPTAVSCVGLDIREIEKDMMSITTTTVAVGFWRRGNLHEECTLGVTHAAWPDIRIT